MKLFAMYATDEQTDRQTDGRRKATLIAPFLRSGHNKIKVALSIGNSKY